MKQADIFMAFFRVGILGYGGGPSSIPLVHKEVVDKYKWMDTDEFGDVLALGNALPGPIATKMAGYIGYRVGGILGMVAESGKRDISLQAPSARTAISAIGCVGRMAPPFMFGIAASRGPAPNFAPLCTKTSSTTWSRRTASSPRTA